MDNLKGWIWAIFIVFYPFIEIGIIIILLLMMFFLFF